MFRLTYIIATAIFIIVALAIVSWSLGLNTQLSKLLQKETKQEAQQEQKKQEVLSFGTVSGKDGSAIVTGIVVYKIEDGQVDGLVLGFGQPERLLIRFPSDDRVLRFADDVSDSDELVVWNTVGQGDVVRVTVAKNDGKRVFLFNSKTNED